MPRPRSGEPEKCHDHHHEARSKELFEDAAQLDDGTLWPTVYAITDITEAGAAAISARLKKAVARPRRGSGAKL